MPQRNKPRRRRIPRGRDVLPPEVPVRVAGQPPAPEPEPETRPDPREEEIRRMIEAAYT